MLNAEEPVIKDDREMFADTILNSDECRVCSSPMYVFDENDICVGCAEDTEEIPEEN